MAIYVVLGATGGIGSELSRQLAANGSQLVLGGRDQGKLDVLADELNAQAVQLDATDIDAVDACIKRGVDTYGQVDGVVNCVGSFMLKPAHLTTQREWEDMIATNLTSAFATVRGAARHMRRSGGAVVLVSSAAARVGMTNHEAIAAAKAGVIGLTLSAAATYAPRGIRINAVAPGLVRTPLAERITSNPTSEKVSLSLHALGRLGEPSDIASMIVWLLDPDNNWVTGQVFGVDGGLGTIHAYGK